MDQAAWAIGMRKEFRKFETLKKIFNRGLCGGFRVFITSVQKHKILGIIITFMLDGFF